MTNYYNSLCNGRDTAHKTTRFGASGGSPNTTKTSRWWLASLFMVMSLFLGQFVSAQVSTYTFAESTETYAQITGTTSTATGDDGTQLNIPIGFTFNFGGVDYTSFAITTNGMIRLNATALASGWVNSLGNAATLRPLIAPFWDDNNLSTGTIRYALTGTSPNQVLSVNWHNTKVGNGGDTGGASVSTILRLYEGTNVIEMVYGTPFTTTNTVSASVGLNDMTSFLSVTPGTTSTVSSTTANNAINATAMANLDGKKLTFTPFVAVFPPDCVTGMLPADASSDIARNPTLSWTAATGGPTSYDIYFGDTSSAPFVTNVSSATLSYSPSVLTANTTYYWKVVAKNDNGDAVGCVEQSFTTGTSFNYCTAVPVSMDTNGITNVVLGSLSNPNVSFDRYQNFATGLPVPDLGTSLSIPMSVTYRTGFTYITRVFIDFNQDGDFNDADENQLLGTSLSAIPTTLNGTITVPATALAGNTRMRVIGYDDDGNSACYSGEFANVEDYTVNITIIPLCSGAPAAAVASSSVPSACVDVPFTLSATGQTTDLGITYQWESADDVAFTTGVTALGTSTTQAIVSQTSTKYYRFSTTCDAGPNTTYSNVVEVTQNAPTACYCIPVTTDGCTDGDVIGRVVLNTLDNASGVGCPSGTLGYSDYTSDPLLTTELQAGSTYACTVTAGEFSGSYAAWIDYNDDGVFDPVTERIGFTSTPVVGSGADSGLLGASASFPITLSCNPPLGVHRLRVREMYNIAGSDMTPCGNNSFGEVEDYLITITAPDPCPIPSTLTASAATATSATLGWKQGCAEAEWDVHVQAVGAGTPSGTPSHPGVLTTSAPGFGTLDVSGLPSGTAYEFYVRAVCETGVLTSNWAGPYTFITVAPGCTSISTPAVTTDLPLGVTVINWDAPAVSASQSAATSYDVYTGTTSGALTLAGNFVSGPFNYTISTYGTSYVQIIPKNAAGVAVGCAETTFTTIPDPCAGVTPLGDTFATPIVLGALVNGTPTTSAGDNLATNCWHNDYTSSSTPGNGSARPGRDVFYQFEIADLCNTLTVATCGATFDTYLHILNASGTRVAFNDDGCGTSSTLTTSALAPGVYYAVVEGYNADTEGTFTLSFDYTSTPSVTYYADADGDTFGDAAGTPVELCAPATGFVTNNLDCDDNNPAKNPGLAEILYNGIDDNCDGQLDEGFERTTALNSSSCSANLVALYTSISAEIKSGVTGYRFEVTNLTNPLAPVQTIDRTVQWFNLTQLASYDYSTTYSIKVMLRVGATWLGYYGDACTVTTPAISTSLLSFTSPMCGSTLASVNTLLLMHRVPRATGYRFEVTQGSTTEVFDTASPYFRLGQLTMGYVYGTTYSVRIAVKTGGSGVYTAYGSACEFTTPNVPQIAECGTTVVAGSIVTVPSLAGVTTYTFEVTTPSGIVIVNRSNRYFIVNSISIPGYTSTTEYSVRVSLTTAGGVSPWSDSCTINQSSSIAPRFGNKTITSEFKANGFPNPFTNNFTLDITTTSEEKVAVMVYDMVGKLLDRVEVNATDNALELGANYPAGVYNVIVSQGEKAETVRMVKR